MNWKDKLLAIACVIAGLGIGAAVIYVVVNVFVWFSTGKEYPLLTFLALCVGFVLITLLVALIADLFSRIKRLERDLQEMSEYRLGPIERRVERHLPY